MAGKRREDVREEDITGLKLFDKLVPMLKSLHDVGCERDKAGDRANTDCTLAWACFAG